jgi:hypothetical protein
VSGRPCIQGRPRSFCAVNSLSDSLKSTRGDGGTRTRDFLLAKQVLYQLSYVPVFTFENSEQRLGHGFYMQGDSTAAFPH